MTREEVVTEAQVPTDLIPLRTVAGWLHMPSRKLVDLAERHEFPRVFDIGGERRVSRAALATWLETRDVCVLAERRAVADRLAKAEARRTRRGA